MSEGRTDIKKGIFRRVRVLYALFFFVGMLIAGKILYLQYGPKGPALRNKGTTITYERVKLEADRGDVLACEDVFWLRPSRCTRYAWISRRTV